VTVSAGPSRLHTWTLVVGSLALAVGGLRGDPGSRVLAWPAAVLLLLAAGRDLALGPALQADAGGLVVIAGLRRVVVPWARVERLRLVTDRRTPVLEVDAGDRLLLLTRWRLGRSPAQVLDELRSLAPALPDG